MHSKISKVALVTGGNRGIGYEICLQLVRRGIYVILGSRDQKKGQDALQGLLQQKSYKAEAIKLDVNKSTEVQMAFEYIKKKFKRLDILVNNAGVVNGSADCIDTEIGDLKDTMQTNFIGPFELSQKLLPLLIKSKDGRIVNVSSSMGAFTAMGRGYASYRISKTALNAFTVILARDLTGTDVKVNAMCPGWVKSDMGGKRATRPVSVGADTAVWLATKTNIGTGKFYKDRKEIPW
jgi:NAD(P)-dependent dehydrogenase (short-subunit alcohol dehydrogenase family)